MMRVNNLPPARSQSRETRCADPSSGDPCGELPGLWERTVRWYPGLGPHTQRQPWSDPAEHAAPGGCWSRVPPSGTST